MLAGGLVPRGTNEKWIASPPCAFAEDVCLKEIQRSCLSTDKPVPALYIAVPAGGTDVPSNVEFAVGGKEKEAGRE